MTIANIATIPADDLRDYVMVAASWAQQEGDEVSFDDAEEALDELVRRAERQA